MGTGECDPGSFASYNIIIHLILQLDPFQKHSRMR